MASKSFETFKNNPSAQKTVKRTVILVIGDIAAFLIFAAVGRRSHGEGNALLQVIGTAAPFALSWLVISPWFGVFRRRLTSTPAKMAGRTALAWLISWPIAILVRSIFEGAIPQWTFWLIALISNMLFLQIWRDVFSFIENRIRH